MVSKIFEILDTYSDREIACMLKYQYDSYGISTQKKIDAYLHSKGLSKSELIDSVVKPEQSNQLELDKACPRCGSRKIIIQNEKKWLTSVGYMLDDSGNVPKIICQVCGYTIKDENRFEFNILKEINAFFKKMLSFRDRTKDLT